MTLPRNIKMLKTNLVVHTLDLVTLSQEIPLVVLGDLAAKLPLELIPLVTQEQILACIKIQ